MESGLIDKQGNKLLCPYYEIENLCKQIIDEFCSESMENQKAFSDFAKEYSYFEPYFDFVIGLLEYSLINPWLQDKNMILCSIADKKSYNRKKYISSIGMYVPYEFGKTKIGFSSDKDLQIKSFTQTDNFYPCFITENGMEIIPNVEGHRELAKQLLNLGMIKDKELCERIAKIDIENEKDTAEVLMWHWPLLRFDDDSNKKCSIIYRSDNITETQIAIINNLEKLKKIGWIYFDQKLSSPAEVFDWSNKFYSKERREQNDNRRI